MGSVRGFHLFMLRSLFGKLQLVGRSPPQVERHGACLDALCVTQTLRQNGSVKRKL